MEQQMQDKFKILRDILFDDEKEYKQTMDQKVEALNTIITEKEKLSDKVNPIINEKLDEFVKEIPSTLGPTITKTLRQEIKSSQDAVVEALYPIIGKMIKRYIAQEFRLLSENINRQTQKIFSFKNIVRKIKSKVFGISEGDLALQEYAKPRLIQMFVIEKHSGILKADFSPLSENKVDKDMIAGMLTAIKSFVEDAFEAGAQDLQLIEYELYNIHIQNFHLYYVAAVISGSYTMMFKEVLEDQIIDFAKNQISQRELEDNTLFIKKLKKHFADDIV